MVRLEPGQNAGPTTSVFRNTRWTPSNFTAVGEMSDLALERRRSLSRAYDIHYYNMISPGEECHYSSCPHGETFRVSQTHTLLSPLAAVISQTETF